MACTGTDSLLLRHHALLELVKDREELARRLLDVGHGALKLVGRVETTQVVRRLARNGRYAVIVVTCLFIRDIHAFIRTISFLLRKERAEAAIALISLFLVQALIRAEVSCRVIVFELFIGTGSLINGVEIAYVAGHANLFSSDVE